MIGLLPGPWPGRDVAVVMTFDTSTLRRRLGLGLVLGLLSAAAALAAVEPILITSVSKQFVVRGRPQTSPLAAGARGDVVYLDPATLAVACERVQQTVSRELAWPDRPRGVIYLDIRPVRGERLEPDLIAFRSDQGWSYRIDLPEEMEQRRTLELVVEALLLQFADRGASHESVVLPPWLVEGLTAHLARERLAGVVLQAHPLERVASDPTLRAPRTVRWKDSDDVLRQRVQESGALTVDQLNWPEVEAMDAAARVAYRHSAELFVRELLRLPGGPDALSATLALLPEHLNWQPAFLRAFASHFTRMVDVEKWWSITVSQWKSHDTAIHWSGARAHEQLEEVLFTPMEVRVGEDAAPHVAPVALQTVINEWEFARQEPLLRQKLSQLELSRRRCTPDWVTLLDGYHQAIAKYLAARAEPRRLFPGRRERNITRDATTTLNALDQQRLQLAARVTQAARDTGTNPLPPRPSGPWSEPAAGVISTSPGGPGAASPGASPRSPVVPLTPP